MARSFDVAVMHDFYVDRLVFSGSVGRTTRAIVDKAEAGGGGIHDVRQEDIRGGNAVNLAHALARLGLRTLLITHSDRVHEGILRQAFEGLDAVLRVKPRPTALTVAFEGKVNVMLGDGRGASDFGPSLLEPGDWRDLKNSGVVCSVNWAINREGTELLAELRKRLGDGKPIFFDPADFRDRIPRFRGLLAAQRAKRLVDWVSMNQQEGAAAAELLGVDTGDLEGMCRGLAGRLRVVFDLHADRASYTSEGTRVTVAPFRPIRAERLTGAGDVWDAAAIFGRLKGMEEAERLKFANVAARLYLKNREPLPPTERQVLDGLR